MAWNEPGGQKDKDPWGGNQGPPDLDEAFRKFKEKFAGKKSGGGAGGNNGQGSGGQLPQLSGGMIAGILAVFVLIWFALGVYQVDQQERGIVLRFGKYHATVEPGLRWNPAIIDSVSKINTTKVRSIRIQGLMLTEDDNIVDVSLSAQYVVIDPKAFLLEVRAPEKSLVQAAESALRHVVGSSSLHQILTEGRIAIAAEVHERLQSYIDLYRTGIHLSVVNIEDAQPPHDVQAAFDDVIRAKEDEARVVNQAQTYKNGVVPEARGQAQRQIEEANAYKGRVVAAASGEAARFAQLLAEYQRAPKVTRERLYIDTMQKVMTNSSKVMVDVDGGNLLYLPLDQLMKGSSETAVRNTDQVDNFSIMPSTAGSANPRPSNTTGRISVREGR